MKMAKCPLCDKEHQILILDNIQVIKCNLITDLSYLNKVLLTKSARQLVKDSLGL